jgi:DNA-binding HxlR family transcriptional regulator
MALSTHHLVRNGDTLKRLRRNYGCPVELSLDFVGGKWRTVILAWLKEAPHRYGELRKRVPGLTDKVLTQRLKELEALGLISKKPVGRRRSTHVYELTARGDSLRPVLDALYDWGSAIASDLKVRIGPQPSKMSR